MRTERIHLRPWREDDAEALFKYASDPVVGPRAGWPPHKSVEESLDVIRNLFSGEGMWAVVWNETSEPIGCVGYLPASSSNLKIKDDEREVGYWIARPYWNKGVCTEALNLVIKHCFKEKGVTTLWGDYFPENPASGRVMEKCGFKDTGELTICPNLEVGGDRPVKVLKLERKDYPARKLWIDNLRWVTVSLVLLYHVIFFYNNKGVFGGIGGFGEGPQYQDILMYVLYPWFMPLLFILAGISAYYALEKRSFKEWFKSRTRKLLVPSTIGLLVIHWITGYFNTRLGGGDALATVPQPVKYFIWAFSGIGPLWFIQVLWLLSLILILPERLDRNGKFRNLCGRLGVVPIILLGVLFWAGERTLVQHPRLESLDGVYNLYKPLFYLVPFLLGYFVFSNDEAQSKIARAWIPMMAAAVISGTVLTVTTFGQDFTSPEYLGSPLNNLYAWLMCLAMMGWFGARFNRTGRFANYMTRTSFGVYVIHYLVVVCLGYMMKTYTSMPPVAMYLILAVAVFALSPILYELARRVPFVRWCVFGEKK